MSDQKRIINIQPLTKEAFEPFGEVIEIKDRDHFAINNGYAHRYHRLAAADVDQGSDVIMSIFTVEPYPYPLEMRLLERHPKGSQAFVPLQNTPFLVVVAPVGEQPDPEQIQAFITDGQQGVNYHRGIWHHPALVLNQNERFLIVDRDGEGNNCDEFEFNKNDRLIINP
ncbi:ureidoglycolate lyase [Veronia pacifica]|uniref:Ureidoglycolate hydrolase n=1 Tax=Veronia pacifica TaxID=1080227 RepID=A0A1C3EG16_9GAMM|nr:ureidoglycolate lyase [Veronia pacifica]ODA32178.1 ureidoglycolate hydrolase [Veronia pacifica]